MKPYLAYLLSLLFLVLFFAVNIVGIFIARHFNFIENEKVILIITCIIVDVLLMLMFFTIPTNTK